MAAKDATFLSFDTLKGLFKIISKLFEARWFSRAWCFHEYHLARKRLIAVPCATKAEGPINSAIGLYNFGDFVLRLVYFQNDRLQKENSDLVGRLLTFFGGQPYAHSNVISNTFSLDSKHFGDKLNIALNICELGLVLKESAVNAGDAQIYLLIAALAAGDVTVLTTRGPRMRYGRHAERTSWLQWPDETTWSRRHTFPAPRGIVSLSLGYICLDLVLISPSAFQKPSSISLRLARSFLRSKIATKIRFAYELQEEGSLYEEDFGVVRSLACAIENGSHWMIKTWSTIEEEVVGEVEQAYKSVQCLARRSLTSISRASQRGIFLHSSPRSRRRTRFHWTQSPPDNLPKASEKRASPPVNMSRAKRITAAFQMLLCIMLFGKFWELGMTVRLPNGTRATTDINRTSQGYEVPAPSEHKLYSKPKSTYYPPATTFFAVPRTLRGQQCALSDRLWLLESVQNAGRCYWRIKEKAALIGPGNLPVKGMPLLLAKSQIIIG